MSETIYSGKDGGTPPGGMPPSGVTEDVAQAAEALEREQQRDPEKRYGQVEHASVGPAGNPGRVDQGRSTGRTGGDPNA